MDFGHEGGAEKATLVNWARPIWFVGVSCPEIYKPPLFLITEYTIARLAPFEIPEIFLIRTMIQKMPGFSISLCVYIFKLWQHPDY